MKKYLASAAALALLGVTAIAAVPPLTAAAAYDKNYGPDRMAGNAMHGHRHAGRAPHRRGGHSVLMLIERFDSDGDGSVSQVEIDGVRAARLAEFDTDGDGQLSIAEYEALWLDAMRERMVDKFQAHDNDGDGQVTVEEFTERMSRLVEMRDRNGDGVLNRDDTGRHGRPGKPEPESEQ